MAIARIRIVLLAAVAALTIGAGVAWAATGDNWTPTATTPSSTHHSVTTPRSTVHHGGNCPHMGGDAGSTTSSAYTRSM